MDVERLIVGRSEGSVGLVEVDGPGALLMVDFNDLFGLLNWFGATG